MARAVKSSRASKSLAKRTPVLEWLAAGLGLVLTLAVIGVSIWEMTAADGSPPELSVKAGAAHPTPGGWVVPLDVANASFATAADVGVEGVQPGPQGEVTRSAAFAYVPARGRATGGLVFPADPAVHPVPVAVTGYQGP